MKKVIEAIRGVMGVSGVVLWEKDANLFHKLLPARFSAAETDAVCTRLVKFCDDYTRGKDVKARFTKGWMWLHNGSSFALLILAKPDLNTTTLNLVLKSSLSTLESNLRKPGGVTIHNPNFTPDHVLVLSRAINLALGHFQGQISRFDIADVLRIARAQLIDHYPVLKHFTVDANGGIIVIKGAEKSMDASVVAAAAQLTAVFIELIKSKAIITGFDIEKITLGIRQPLDEIGFYNYFASARRSVTT
ncbi:MAG: hypothetical protein WBP29_09760 [Candidatus Zixiibacteriota bacterium]